MAIVDRIMRQAKLRRTQSTSGLSLDRNLSQRILTLSTFSLKFGTIHAEKDLVGLEKSCICEFEIMRAEVLYIYEATV
jgi:hypothetical protein